MRIPQKLQDYTINTFYTNFPTSEVKIVQGYTVSGERRYLDFSSGCEFYDASTFGTGEKYVDPFREVLSFFQGMPPAQEVMLLYDNRFDDSLNFRQKCKNFVKNLSKDTTQSSEETPKEANKDQQQQDQIKRIGRDVRFSISCRIKGTTHKQEVKTLQDGLANVFDKFLHQ